jgi:hypothetical protein
MKEVSPNECYISPAESEEDRIVEEIEAKLEGKFGLELRQVRDGLEKGLAQYVGMPLTSTLRKKIEADVTRIANDLLLISLNAAAIKVKWDEQRGAAEIQIDHGPKSSR